MIKFGTTINTLVQAMKCRNILVLLRPVSCRTASRNEAACRLLSAAWVFIFSTESEDIWKNGEQNSRLLDEGQSSFSVIFLAFHNDQVDNSIEDFPP